MLEVAAGAGVGAGEAPDAPVMSPNCLTGASAWHRGNYWNWLEIVRTDFWWYRYKICIPSASITSTTT